MTAKSITHKFHSAVADGADTTIVRPSNWNDDHYFFLGINAQSGTSYTFADGDDWCLATFNNASAVAVTLPQAGTGSNPVVFPSGWIAFVRNKGAGAVTITPSTSTIDGGSSIVLAQNQGCIIVSDGTNYTTLPFLSAVSTALSGTPTAPTAASSTNSTQISTTAFVQNLIAAGLATFIAVVGSAATPAFAFAGRTDTGIFSPASAALGIATGGSERARMTNSLWSLGANSTTNPAFQVDYSAGSVATGWQVTGAAAASGADLKIISSGTNENGTINAKGSGTLTLQGTATGNITLGRNTGITGTATVTSSNASGLTVGPNGATNPTLQVDGSTSSAATGLKIKSAAAAAGLALSVITSGTNENLTIDAAGSGTITLGGTSTGAITHTRATTLSAALTYGGVTLSNAVTGTGNMALSASPTFTGTISAAAFTGSGILKTTDSTASTSTTTGSGQFGGGVGIAGRLNVGSNINVAGTMDIGNGGLPFASKACVVDNNTSSSIGVFTVQNTHATAGDQAMFVAAGSNAGDTTSVLIRFMDGGINTTQGSVARNGNGAVIYNTTSDIRGKPNRERLSLDYARSIIDALAIWDFDKEGNAIRGIGVIAQEARAVHRTLAWKPGDPKEWWQAEKAASVPFLVANMQQINTRLDDHAGRLAALERAAA